MAGREFPRWDDLSDPSPIAAKSTSSTKDLVRFGSTTIRLRLDTSHLLLLRPFVSNDRAEVWETTLLLLPICSTQLCARIYHPTGCINL